MAIADRVIGSLSPRMALKRAIRLIDAGNAKEAFPLLSRAARAHIPEAEYRIGKCYLEGTGVPPSRTDGARWM
ncbi:MAG: hypothetical protein AB7O80_07200, partial [Acetobacteraceae bacterium]